MVDIDRGSCGGPARRANCVCACVGRRVDHRVCVKGLCKGLQIVYADSQKAWSLP